MHQSQYQKVSGYVNSVLNVIFGALVLWQSQVASPLFQDTSHPRWVHLAESACSPPFVSRYIATGWPSFLKTMASPGFRSSGCCGLAASSDFLGGLPLLGAF